jgi:hypothetical protein
MRFAPQSTAEPKTAAQRYLPPGPSPAGVSPFDRSSRQRTSIDYEYRGGAGGSVERIGQAPHSLFQVLRFPRPRTVLRRQSSRDSWSGVPGRPR